MAQKLSHHSMSHSSHTIKLNRKFIGNVVGGEADFPSENSHF